MTQSVNSLEQIANEIGQLPEDWHLAGTVHPSVLHAIVKYAGNGKVGHSVETGSGKTTMVFSHISLDHKVFALDAGNKSIDAVRAHPLFNSEVVEFIEGPSQKTLPPYQFDYKIQIALIDGPHGYPFPDLEYYYLYPHMAEGGILIVDDVHIPTIRNLFDFLKEDSMFELLEVVETTAFFKRTNAELFSPIGDGWWLQPYNKARFPVPTDAQKAAAEFAAAESANVQLTKEGDAKLEEMQLKLRKIEAEIQNVRLELERSQNRIVAMESSKFWKLRTLWFQLKHRLGLLDDSEVG